MLDIFSSSPGAVVAVNSPVGIPVRFFVEEWGDYAFFKSIITGFDQINSNGLQTRISMRDFLYFYTFGERPGQFILTGISFAFQCGNPNLLNHGLEYVYRYYLNNRTNSRGFPILIMMGHETPIYGFLTNVSMGMREGEETIGRFRLQFTTIPVLGAIR